MPTHLPSQLSEIPRIIRGLADLHGDGFFEAITLELAQAIAADYVFIGTLIDDQSEVRTIAVCHEDQSVANFNYPLTGTPCEQVVSSSACAYREGVCQIFPDDKLLDSMDISGYLGIPLSYDGAKVRGLMVALFKSPIQSLDQARWIFDLFAGRVSAELENQRASLLLQQLNRELEHKYAELEEYKRELESRVDKRTAELELEKQRAEEANSAKSAFLAMMSHEVRTPLNGVLGMAELLEHSDLGPVQKQYLHSLQQSGSTLKHVVNDILDYSRVASGDFELAPANVEIIPWLENLIALYQTQVADSVALKLEIDPRIQHAYFFDEHRVHQLLNNLLNNAVKFTNQGEICLTVGVVHTNTRSSRLEFSVRDSGIGIPAGAMRRIFLPFSQADSRILRKYGGTGLGLTLCRMIVESMGGKLNVSSQEGRGTRFSFALDIAHGTMPEQAQKPAENDARADDYTGLNVVVVDDNPVNRRLVKAQLAELGIDASLFSRAHEALAAINTPSRDIDLVLMDCEMPELNGFEATECIRDWEAKNDSTRIPIYALTAHALKEHEAQCLAAGMDGRLTKPISMEDYLPLLSEISLKRLAG